MSDHELRLGDCLDPLTGLASLADKSVDHVICDPPYEAEAHTLQRLTPRGSGRGFSVPESKPITFDAITEEARSSSALEMARIARRWVIVFCQAEAIAAWRSALVASDILKWKRTMLWVKPDAQPNLMGDRPGVGYETMALAHGAGRSRWHGGGKCAVYSFNRKHPFSRPNEHPTEKPLSLMEQLISDFTDPGELICDPFAGSGTTLVACKRLGRRAIGWEKDATFWERAVRRLENTKQQYELLPRGPKPRQQKMVLP